MNKPLKGEVWLVRLDPTEGREQAKTRPCVIISNNKFNRGFAELVIALPVTSKNKKIPLHIQILPSEGSLNFESFIMPEQIRSVSTNRCIKKIGYIPNCKLDEIEFKLKILLDFE